MFEIGIVCVIILAVAYWTVLWLMGRREDVLHGEFVEGKAEPKESVRATVAGPQVRPVFLERPAFPARSASPERPTLAERTASPARSALPKPPVFPKRPTLPERPAQATAPEQPAFRPERLEKLLNSIKQDLNQLVQK
ncbi:MAG: hypothetical protein ABJA75_00705 [Bradyrhizobium sp.]